MLNAMESANIERTLEEVLKELKRIRLIVQKSAPFLTPILDSSLHYALEHCYDRLCEVSPEKHNPGLRRVN
jgi:hypothetical protein